MKKFKDIMFNENACVWIRDNKKRNELFDYLNYLGKVLVTNQIYSDASTNCGGVNRVLYLSEGKIGSIENVDKDVKILGYDDIVDGDLNLLKTKEGKWIEVKIGDEIEIYAYENTVCAKWKIKEIKNNKLKCLDCWYNLSTGKTDEYNGNIIYAIDPEKTKYTLPNEKGEQFEVKIGDTVYVLFDNVFSGDIRKIKEFGKNSICDDNGGFEYENETGRYVYNRNIKISLFPPKPKLNIDWDMIPNATHITIDSDGEAWWYDGKPFFNNESLTWSFGSSRLGKLGNWGDKIKGYPVYKFSHLLIYKRGE